MQIKTNDIVSILTGMNKGAQGKVLKVHIVRGLVLVEGINKVFKHMKKSRQNPRGGRLEKEMPVQISNVMLICPKCGQPARTGIKLNADGSKYRVCKKCSGEIGQLSRSKAAKAAAK